MTKERIEQLLSKIALLKKEISKNVVGQHEVIEQLIVGLIAGGHVLLEGVPGLAKTLMIKTLSQVLSIDYNRIQFTPDLMPSDILGTEILQVDDQGNRAIRFEKGPVFTNILLADEINRTPPKTQSALLELMQEYGLSYAGNRYDLPKPFFLLATQNPIEQAGTFPLPEAQVDRFLLHIVVDYPNADEEYDILKLTTGTTKEAIDEILTTVEILQLQQLCREVHIDDNLIRDVSKLIRTTRPAETTDQYIKDYVDWGAGPRAGQALILAAKAYALTQARYSVIPNDIKQMLLPTLRHRFILNFKASSQGITPSQLVDHLIGNYNIG
jgi:MoxR-like ATPase